MSLTLKQLAELCDARIEGGNLDAAIFSASDITSAQEGQVTQLTNAKYTRYMKDTQASACFVAETFVAEGVPDGTALLRCEDPEMAFIKAVGLLHPIKKYEPEVSAQASVSGTAKIGEGVHVGAFAYIGDESDIGSDSVIFPGAYVGNLVKIGKNCRIHPYAVIYDHTEIGDNVVIHSGAIIGADGFGYKFRGGAHVKVPQVGNVVIESHVEIGANTCVDRGALGSTVIGQGSKIDNLVQIGHNNKVGKHVIMCGHTGVSGSCSIGDYAILAGSAGVADHVNIGQGAVIMARSGVAGDVPAGAQYFGSPAKDKKLAYKEQIALSQLPELVKRVKMLEKELERISLEIGENQGEI